MGPACNSIRCKILEAKIPNVPRKWSTPDAGRLKINVDGSFVEHSMTVGWGFIIRNHDGLSIGSGARKIDHCEGAMYAELTGVMQALLLAGDAGMDGVVV